MPIDLCLEAPIADASLFLHCLILPQILFHIDTIFTVQAFVEHCSGNLPILGSYIREISKDSFNDLLEAMTAKSCRKENNYDRFEFVGDAVLKLVHTDALLHSTTLRNWVSYLHEGASIVH
jgi:dsRNA-specific ribonuclease